MNADLGKKLLEILVPKLEKFCGRTFDIKERQG